MSDEHDERAARILPCRCVRGVSWDADYHVPSCPAYKRPALAAEFRADAEKRDQEHASALIAIAAQQKMSFMLDDLRAELERVKAENDGIKWAINAKDKQLGELNKNRDGLCSLVDRQAARLEQAEKERDELRASLQRASYSGLRGNVANLRIELHDLKVKHQYELDAARLNALRELDSELDTIPFANDADSALSFKYRVKSRIAAMIDAGKECEGE